MSVSRSDHGRIMVGSVGTIHGLLAQTLSLHFFRNSLRIGVFEILDFYCCCVLRGERNESVTFL